ncbi:MULTISPECIES: hypothetical protein [Catenuloplanes]|uniref:Uncharacterized protein n=1 Tax=Catenuloplanes niger TaxID=587534 RepID=A0AAE4CWI2_9ACTN|nr:hypothetical protein [Catenuloplanes niger]MDR7327250.1 hypothetical protein [Catenuloplanes niger]
MSNPFDAPKPFPGTPVLPWPATAPAPALPPGTAGIAIRVRRGGFDSPHFRAARAIGVDDRPLWHGLDRAVAVVEPGTHLVEVRDDTGAESIRRVEAVAGEITEWHMWSPATYGRVPGILVPAAQARRRPGPHAWGIVAGFAAMAVVPQLLGGLGGVVVLIGMLAAFPLALFGVGRIKKVIDDRYRVAVSTAAEGRTDPAEAEDGMFLGHADVPPGVADTTHGVLLLTADTTLKYSKDGRDMILRPTVDRNTWIPWPRLTIDGRSRRLAWQNWAYRLPPGPHELLVTPQAPATPDNVPGVAPQVTVTPVRVPVDIRAGETTRLHLTVHATVAVRSNPPAPVRSTSLTDFTATVEAGPAS